jgi:LmbE family N-acetylglucosaminyl deacetylase
LLLVVAHPDDETFGCGSLLLLAADQGWETTVVCATRGEAGELTRGCALGGRTLADVRERKLRQAADVLGVSRLLLLDFIDSGMDGAAPAGSLFAADPTAVAAAVHAAAIELDPDVIVSLDAADGHRDHARVRDASVLVAAERGIPVYLQALPRSLMDRWVEHMTEARPEMAHLKYAELGTPDDQIAVVLDTNGYLTAREQAIAVHRSQTTPYEGLPEELRRDFLTREYLLDGQRFRPR